MEAEGLGARTLMAADGKLIIMEEQGNLIVAEASPKAFKELARARSSTASVGRVPSSAAAGSTAGTPAEISFVWK